MAGTDAWTGADGSMPLAVSCAVTFVSKGRGEQPATQSLPTQSMMLEVVPLLTLILSVNFNSAASKCVMYGKCGEGPSAVGSAGIPCVSNSDPLLVNTSELTPNEAKIFQELCGFNLTSQELCCDHTQIKDLVASASTLKGFFFTCPACLHNLYSYICGLSCDPEQATFTRVNQSEIAQYDPKKRQVVQSIVSVASTYRDAIYSSCSQVTSDSLGPVVKSVLCTQAGDCDGRNVLATMGSTDNAPFQCSQEYDDDKGADPTRHFMNLTTYACKAVLSKDVWPINPSACTCSNCLESCFSPVFPSWNDHSTQLKVMDFTLLGLFMLSSAITVAIALVSSRRQKSDATPCENGSTSQLASGDNNADNNEDKMRDDNADDNSGDNGNITLGVQKESKIVNWILFVTRYPKSIIFLSILLFGLFACGLFTLKMQADPVELWSAPNARARLEKKFFDEHFGPFYRVQQVIVTADDTGNFTADNVTFSPIFDRNFLLQMLDLKQKLISVKGSSTNATLNEFCFAPLGDCLVQSPLNYFQSNRSLLEMYNETSLLDHLGVCLKNPLDVKDASGSCLGEWGGPGLREVVLGGYDDTTNYTVDWHRYTTARSFIITMLLQDSINQTYRQRAEDFEQSWLNILHNASAQMNYFTTSHGQNVTYRMSYFSGRSVGDEISRQSESDVLTIGISYLLMFVYISLTLGSFTTWKRMFIDSKVSLGLAGVLIVLASVIMSIGALSPIIHFNLIIIEVIPFLILAIGVDNMFLMVIQVRRDLISHREESSQDLTDDVVAHIISNAIGNKIGQSILISVVSESACFLIGYFVTSMPAVKVFALTAGVALLILLFLQFSTFVALLYLDSCRYVRNWPDPVVCPFHFAFCCCCITSGENIELPASSSKSIFEFICGKILAPIVTTKASRTFIIVIWIFTLLACIDRIPRTEVGLDQEDSVPRDSYVLRYMKDQKELLRVGAPLYFVVDSSDLQFNYSQAAVQQAVCGSGNSSDKSLDNIVKVWSQEGPYKDNFNTKFIRSHATSWINEFLNVWYRNNDCCKVLKDPEYDNYTLCDIENTTVVCDPCADTILPEELQGDLFKTLLKGFLSQKPGPPPHCPSGGSAQYPYSIDFTENYDVAAAYYSTYHLPARSSQDMVNSIITARRVSDEIEESLKAINSHVKVFPYSIFYVFYEQYLTTWMDTGVGLSASSVAVLLVVFLSRKLGHLVNHIVFTAVLISFTLHVLGLISYMGVSLNALTIVNLIMSIGISVEFIAHISIGFAEYMHQEPKSERLSIVRTTLQMVGAPVLAGITLTKLVGIAVLYFATSQIFTIYYFRFYTALIIVGAYHGLIVLPAILATVGR